MIPLFKVDKEQKKATEISATTFKELGLWERKDLEQWVVSTPAIVGTDLRVLTSEYDRFDKTDERLDVIGLVRLREGIGRLVVIELKRHGESTTVDLQAIKYAAYLSSASFDDVCQMYADDQDMGLEEASTELGEWVGSTEGDPPRIDATPRIILLAGDFKREVTTTVLWLIDNFGLDIQCTRLLPYEIGEELVIASEQLIPLPAAEDYRLGIQKKKEAEQKEASAKQRRLLPRLFDAGLIKEGDVLRFKRSEVPSVSDEEYEASPRYRATVVDPIAIASLEWRDSDSDDSVRHSPSLLAAWVFELESGGSTKGVTSAGINGYKHWTLDGEVSLRDLAFENNVPE